MLLRDREKEVERENGTNHIARTLWVPWDYILSPDPMELLISTSL